MIQRHITTWLRNTSLILGITLLALLLLEFSASLYYNDEKAGKQRTDNRARADSYAEAPWAEAYWREFKSAHDADWTPFVYWRRKPFQGEYINIDQRGIRRTWRDDPAGSQQQGPRIFFFGGSTTWGTGARDDFTIPSLFAKQLAREGLQADVTNFGESGYISTQSLLSLMRELQRGNIPDRVIFYSGVNDTYAAYMHTIAGIPQNEQRRVLEFNSLKREKKKKQEAGRLQDTVTYLSENLYTLRFISEKTGLEKNHNARGKRKRTPLPPDIRSEKAFTGNEALAADVLDIYQENVAVVRDLAARHGFSASFYWQPMLFQKDHLTAYEEKKAHKFRHARPLYEITYAMAHQRLQDEWRDLGIRDISNVLSDHQEPLYLDWCHLNETGNAYIANIIASDTLSALKLPSTQEDLHPGDHL